MHFFLPEAYLIGAPLALLARIPIQVMSRRSLNVYQNRYPLLRQLEHTLHRVMKAIVANSRRVIAELKERENVPVERLGLIYNGLELGRFAKVNSRFAVRSALGIAPLNLVLVVVANLIPYKGHSDLLSALALVKQSMPVDWRLLIVGRDDGIAKELHEEAAALGLSAHILFLGSRGDVPDLLMASDIGLLCSHQEGFSNSILEGMAAGLPMIVTDVGGNPEAVLDGKSGLVVPARDPYQLGQAILRLAGDASLRAELGEAARERVAEQFTFERCIESYEALYRALLADKLPAEVPEIRVMD